MGGRDHLRAGQADSLDQFVELQSDQQGHEEEEATELRAELARGEAELARVLARRVTGTSSGPPFVAPEGAVIQIPTVDEIRVVVREELARALRELPAANNRPCATITEAAEQLSVSTRTIRRRIKSGELPTIGSGRSVRVDMRAFAQRSELEPIARAASMAMAEARRR